MHGERPRIRSGKIRVGVGVAKIQAADVHPSLYGLVTQGGDKKWVPWMNRAVDMVCWSMKS
jgi:hypothetical protein